MISVLFAVLTALSNGSAAVLQRRAASTVPDSATLRLSLIRHLLRKRVWLAGIGLVIVAAFCQAVALATGPITIVQPIFVIELPLTLLIASHVFRTRLPFAGWFGVAAVTIGLVLGLGAAAPYGGKETVDTLAWVPALIVTGVFEVLVIAAGRRARGNARAALFALAAACAYALTAALLKDAVARIDDGAGAVAFFTSWQLYATAVAGIGALFLLQNALQAGSLVASQPMLTLGDALISITYGVTLFGEGVRTGWWLLPELLALVLIGAGCVELARSPLAGGTAPPKPRAR
ncbi:DMT family transporter [Streptomyces sp. NBC_01498]|uniref:DMT family transporter n=1 Tax=Streptomyces sp. NBC_01498 TaxID=2975870 RepID=UPI002E7BD1C7|nr:DMT family transporter [Streptomyces sp. NBC_01498]WTL28545.1 DMT family transporter [Streptomyces sp. NBC_01498]